MPPTPHDATPQHDTTSQRQRGAGGYCLLHQDGRLRAVTGRVVQYATLGMLPRGGARPLHLVAMVPFAQLSERGMLAKMEGEKILALEVQEEVDPGSILSDEVSTTIELEDEPRYNMSDREFTEMVRSVIEREIKRGEGSNFLLSRKCFIKFKAFSPAIAHTIFRRLMRSEFGAYLNFCFFDGSHFFIGSSPERQMSFIGERVTMNPICGTLPKAALPTGSSSEANAEAKRVMTGFLTDPKEVNELFQVVDEELKMMCKICSSGGAMRGPRIREMRTLFHTDYELEGVSQMDKLDAFRLSMFPATMVGSPLESAARVIARYEPDSRRYYSSALLMIGADETGQEWLDSAITIRTIEVDAGGHGTLQTGASIVRDSQPESECREIEAKALGMLRAIQTESSEAPLLPSLLDETLQRVLLSRNANLSSFWVEQQGTEQVVPAENAPSILIVDHEDEFTYMLRHMLGRIAVRADVVRYDAPHIDTDAYDLVLVGPGPGDPENLDHPKIARAHKLVRRLLDEGRPMLAVCLGHQILCRQLGLPIARLDPPLQGVQKSIDLFGRTQNVGFYNTFVARCEDPRLASGLGTPGIQMAVDSENHVYALRGERVVSFQFHVESVLTTEGLTILQEAVGHLMPEILRRRNAR